MLNTTTLTLMGFEIALLLLTIACVYLRLIPNDLLILALGVVIRGTLGVVPTVNAIQANTAATQANTEVTKAVVVEPTKGIV